MSAGNRFDPRINCLHERHPVTETRLDPSELVACPNCDTLHHLQDVPEGARARCMRCNEILMAPKGGAMTRIVVLAVTALILMIAVVFFPFLDLSASGLEQHSSVLDAIMAFSDGMLLPLTFAVAAFVVVLPAVRLMAIIYAIGPLIFDRPARPHAARAFRLAQTLRPWSMAEIFIVGVAVALVKIAGMATVSVGPAFWALVALVLVTTIKDTFMCKLTIWKTLETQRRS